MGNENLMFFAIQILVAIGVFAVLVYIAKFTANKIRSIPPEDSKFLNPEEFLLSEEALSLKHLYYLIMIFIFILTILYLIFNWHEGLFFMSILDIVISIYLAIDIGKDSFKEKLILFLLIPIGSLIRILFGYNVVSLIDIFHIFGYLYFIKVYNQKFLEYRDNTELGITIILLFTIILVSFLFTVIIEGVSPMHSITMVSNAFTSNSFEPSGNIMIGKLNSLILAWGGFFLSITGTATLTVSIVKRRMKPELDDLKKVIKEKKKEK